VGRTTPPAWHEYPVRRRGKSASPGGLRCALCASPVRSGERYHDAKGSGRVHASCAKRETEIRARLAFWQEDELRRASQQRGGSRSS
jgi:hypothetical protein